MGRGPESRESKMNKALAAARAFLGEDVELSLPVESVEDKLNEATAVAIYHETSGRGFRAKVCKNCGGTFSFLWDRDAIAFCSVTCAHADLKKRGLSWNPNRTARDRWGKTAPLVVPPQALTIVTEILSESEEVPASDTTSQVQQQPI